MSIKVLVVDDNAIMRRGVTTLLASDGSITVVGEAENGNQALTVAGATEPDVVLLDVRMPGRDGLSVVSELARRSRVLMLTFSDEPDVVREALDSGAVGYLVHGTFDADALSAMVVAASAGMSTLSGPALAAARSDGGVESPPTERKSLGLSERQVEVMELISAGRSNQAIAQEMFLSEKTIKNHINQIFSRLGVSTRAEAMALWRDR